MARMSIDDSFLRDPRVARLARACGWSVYEARGRLLEVYAICYDRKDDTLVDHDIDIAASSDGFAAQMVAVELADALRGGRKFRIKGAAERIEYLRKLRESAVVGGVKSGESRRQKRSNGSTVRFDEVEATASPPSPVPDSAPDPVPDLVPVPEGRESAPAAPTAARSRSRPSKPSAEPTPAERAVCDVVLSKLGARNGVTYRGAPPHLRLITARLRDGCTEADLRKVIHYAASSRSVGGLGWADDEKMRVCLRPETLFGPETIARYLDPAVAWCADPKPSAAETPTRADRPEPAPIVLEILGGGKAR